MSKREFSHCHHNVKETLKTEVFGQLQINKASMWGCCGNHKGVKLNPFAYKEHN